MPYTRGIVDEHNVSFHLEESLYDGNCGHEDQSEQRHANQLPSMESEVFDSLREKYGADPRISPSQDYEALQSDDEHNDETYWRPCINPRRSKIYSTSPFAKRR